MIEVTVNGVSTSIPADGTLLDALREHAGVRSPKDGCSPQGQCGCCTVWVDGRPRVACVTPTARVAGRVITTLEGLDDADRWADAFTAAGASQCGFCTPGIIMRLAALGERELVSSDVVRRQLLAHLCRCTGWQTIVDAATALAAPTAGDAATTATPVATPARTASVDVSDRAVARAAIEGGVAQDVGRSVALGRGGFADDVAPRDALVAMRRPDGTWVVAGSVAEARAASGKVQGRRSTAPVTWPLQVPAGDWARSLRTTWVEPGYLEPDAAWCAPGGAPTSPLGNGGAFGGKAGTGFGSGRDIGVAEVARRLADEHGRPVRVLASREDVVRRGPKRPPLAIGMRADGTGVVHAARTPGIVEVITACAPGLTVLEVDVAGPPTSAAVRGAGWAEVAAVVSSLRDGPDTVVSPSGASATALVADDGSVHVRVRCGADPADEAELTVLRSYCIGAAHMALGWVRSEAIAVDAEGVPVDLTIRSFGILRAVDTPAIHVEIDADGTAVGGADMSNGSDAAFAAVAAAAWRASGFPDRWPARDGYGRVP